MLKINGQELIQRGFTLIELLVGLAVGLIVLTGLIMGWGHYVQQSSYLLSSAQFNHDIRATLQVITQDLRRAVPGAGQKSAVQLACLNSANCTVGANPLVVGDCVVFNANVSDVDTAAAAVAPTLVPSGYRLSGGNLEMWFGGAANASLNQCAAASAVAGAAGWVPIASVGESGLQSLVFQVSKASSRCLALFVNNSETAGPCAAAATENVELLLIDVVLQGTAQLSNRDVQSFSFSDRIKVRNDSLFQ
jgi:type IV pilus assembly protein PilW